MEEVISTSSAGKGAQAVLQGQANSLQARVKTLTEGFQKEEEALRTGFQNKTLTQQAAEAKAKDIEGRKQSAQAEISGRQRTLQARSEEHTSELQSLMRISYAVFCLKKKQPTPYKQSHTFRISTKPTT